MKVDRQLCAAPIREYVVRKWVIRVIFNSRDECRLKPQKRFEKETWKHRLSRGEGRKLCPQTIPTSSYSEDKNIIDIDAGDIESRSSFLAWSWGLALLVAKPGVAGSIIRTANHSFR
jgi:hypothetical protein